MRTLTRAGRVVIGTLFMLGCQSLDITNPNAPDASRALTDPSAIEAIAGGTLRSFFNTYNGLEAVGPLTTQARSHTASWNNYNMNFYSSVDGDGTRRTRGWQNDPATSRRTAIEWFWEGYYSTASSAMDVLIAIRNNDLSFGSVAATARAEAVAELMLGASLGQIAINYDKGYVIDETADLIALEYVDRKTLRDAALVKLENAARIATATSFTLPSAWTNGGGTYSNLDVARLARTMAAMTLAYWPRTEAENAAMGTTYWARVATLASQGLTQDFVFVGDGCEAYCPEMQSWTNDLFGIRVHTRVANRMDPTIKTPYDSLNDGSPAPNSPDARLGDGSFGTADMEGDYGTIAKTANAGTDFAWSGYEAFFATRGQYHQSNIGHIRWDASGTQSTNSIYYGYGPVPLVMKAQNDLIHAEALLRSGGSTATAATLINNTRVGRGKLAAATSGEGVTSLLAKLDYENEIELLSQGASTFYNRRRTANGLLEGTPREMPVPAKELGVKVEALYTWGGTGSANSATPANAGTLPP
jgi:hypothetical protein